MKDIDKTLVYKRESYVMKNSIKWFIGHDDNDYIRLLCKKKSCKKIMYVKKFI